MSYNIRPQKWGDPTRGTESGEIEWSMDLSGGGLQMVSGTSMGDYTGAMQAAFDRWEEVADIDFTYVGTAGGDVSVDMAFLPGSTVGQATWNGGSVINFGMVEMDTEVLWSPYGGSGGVNFYAVALHEIGHILGFNHVDDTSEIMNGFISTGDLGDGDIAGAQVLYGVGSATPAPSPSPPPPSGGDPRLADTGGDDGGSSGGGAILGLLALIAGLIFGLGSGGAALAFAAATAAPEGDDDPLEDDEPVAEDDDEGDELLDEELISAKACGHDGPCDCGHEHDDEPVLYTHNVYLTEADLIEAEGADWASHDHSHGHDHEHGHGDGCGCGMCTGMLDNAQQPSGEMTQQSDNVVLLTDIIPVTGMLEESACGALDTEEVEEDLLDYV